MCCSRSQLIQGARQPSNGACAPHSTPAPEPSPHTAANRIGSLRTIPVRVSIVIMIILIIIFIVVVTNIIICTFFIIILYLSFYFIIIIFRVIFIFTSQFLHHITILHTLLTAAHVLYLFNARTVLTKCTYCTY